MDSLQGITQWILRLFCRKGYYEQYHTPDEEIYFKKGFVSSVEFFNRFENKVDFKGKSVLDVGSGNGATCFYMALNGAKKVVGIDISEDGIAFAKSKRQSYSNIKGILEFRLPSEMATEKFDLVLSKDSFEHYDNPEDFILTLKQYLKPNGQLVIGFSPLWKSPYGGHIGDMTRLPWVHLLFPEPVLMRELRRFLRDENVKSFKHIASGLNKMTLKRYLRIVQDGGFEFEFFRTNVSSTPKDRCYLKIFRILCLIPSIREYFTVNLYSILRVKDRSINQKSTRACVFLTSSFLSVIGLDGVFRNTFCGSSHRH